MDGLRSHVEHIILHVGMRRSHAHCPECTADHSRTFARNRTFSHTGVPADQRSKYLAWVRPRIEAIRNGAIEQGRARSDYRPLWWQEEFLAALHNRITSHMAGRTGRKFAPEYAKYHLATYGNDYRYLHGL